MFKNFIKYLQSQLALSAGVEWSSVQIIFINIRCRYWHRENRLPVLNCNSSKLLIVLKPQQLTFTIMNFSPGNALFKNQKQRQSLNLYFALLQKL